MAEPVLRDPVPPEPVRRRGPQSVRAATAKVSPSGEPGSKVHIENLPVENVPMEQVPAESAPAAPIIGLAAEEPATPGTLRPETGTRGQTRAPAIDPARELPAPPPAAVAEPPQFASESATAAHGSGTVRSARTHPASRRPPEGRTPSQEMLDELRSRLDNLRERVEQQTTATGISLKRELAQDADYIKIRARYYHQRQPIQALGMVAAGGFVLGVFLGLWRR